MQAYLRRQIVKYYLPIILLLSLCANVHALSPVEAAERAKSRTGGKVLQVKNLGENHYRVKVLMPNGQVRSLSIGQPTEESDKENAAKNQ